ncbi:MAG TPA: glycosyltransferase family 4 protein [Acidothermaceae bacterium]|nr:glycosyltransferase family 4 protein [Acidothermaceae bacterium]
MRVGLVCPYTWDVPGGVQAHVHDLATALLALGHDVSVITPADDDAPLPPYVVSAGRAVPVPYNGSVARLAFGVLSLGRVRRWLREGAFDVVHVHEPAAPSLSLLATWAADVPIVATFHTSVSRSRAMAAAYSILQTALEKISGRIAVSEAARRTLVEHLGGDAVLIPNGVQVSAFATARPLPDWPGDGGAIGFLGRIDEPRKGFPLLLEAFQLLAAQRPGLRLLVAGPGDTDEAPKSLPEELRSRVRLLGLVSDADKARMLRSVNLFVAPNTGGESFGIVLLEAMAAQTPVLASDLDAFRVVLDDGEAGALFATGDAAALAEAAGALLDDRDRRARLAASGARRALDYDWSTVARDIVRVYETVAHSSVRTATVPRQGR